MDSSQIAILLYSTHSTKYTAGAGGGTGQAAAGPKLNRTHNLAKFFTQYIAIVTDNNKSTNDATYYLCKTIALLARE